jgi:trypsin
MFKFALFALLAVSASAKPRNLGPPRLTDKRIVGGEEVEQGAFPQQVSVHIYGSHACGGSLLSANAALTAGHCCAYPVREYEVVAGEHSLRGDDGTEETRNVKQIRQHENYDDFALTDDICVLILDGGDIEEVEGSIAYTKLAGDNREPEDLETLVVTGWGTTSEGGSLSDILKMVEVPYVPNDRCADEYAGFNDVTDGMLCAGNEDEGGVDACQGDSGGPIFFQDGEQVGLTSWGYGCARPGYPGVYTRTTYYNDWIATNSA